MLRSTDICNPHRRSAEKQLNGETSSSSARFIQSWPYHGCGMGVAQPVGSVQRVAVPRSAVRLRLFHCVVSEGSDFCKESCGARGNWVWCTIFLFRCKYKELLKVCIAKTILFYCIECTTVCTTTQACYCNLTTCTLARSCLFRLLCWTALRLRLTVP